MQWSAWLSTPASSQRGLHRGIAGHPLETGLTQGRLWLTSYRYALLMYGCIHHVAWSIGLPYCTLHCIAPMVATHPCNKKNVFARSSTHSQCLRRAS